MSSSIPCKSHAIEICLNFASKNWHLALDAGPCLVQPTFPSPTQGALRFHALSLSGAHHNQSEPLKLAKVVRNQFE